MPSFIFLILDVSILLFPVIKFHIKSVVGYLKTVLFDKFSSWSMYTNENEGVYTLLNIANGLVLCSWISWKFVFSYALNQQLVIIVDETLILKKCSLLYLHIKLSRGSQTNLLTIKSSSRKLLTLSFLKLVLKIQSLNGLFSFTSSVWSKSFILSIIFYFISSCSFIWSKYKKSLGADIILI